LRFVATVAAEAASLTAGTGPGIGPLLSLQGGGNDLWGQVEVVPEVLDALVGEVPETRKTDL
jgi:hypothetical protein